MSPPNRTSLVFGVLVAAACAVLFAAYGIAVALFHSRESQGLLQYAAAFGCFGFMCGAILAFDAEHGDRHEGRALLRTLLSALAGVAFGLVLEFPKEGIVLSGLVAGILGYIGMKWAKHV
jgi:drug/metabolite transporter (DMT)-like permease